MCRQQARGPDLCFEPLSWSPTVAPPDLTRHGLRSTALASQGFCGELSVSPRVWSRSPFSKRRSQIRGLARWERCRRPRRRAHAQVRVATRWAGLQKVATMAGRPGRPGSHPAEVQLLDQVVVASACSRRVCRGRSRIARQRSPLARHRPQLPRPSDPRVTHDLRTNSSGLPHLGRGCRQANRRGITARFEVSTASACRPSY